MEPAKRDATFAAARPNGLNCGLLGVVSLSSGVRAAGILSFLKPSLMPRHAQDLQRLQYLAHGLNGLPLEARRDGLEISCGVR